MISDLWTLEPAGSPGSAETLHGLGVTSASLVRPSQAAATLSLAFDAAPAWAWESQWVLRRDGIIQLRARVATPPSISLAATSEGATVELRDAWWDLERTPYTQEWRHVDTSGPAEIRTGHARLGRSTLTGERETTIQSLSVIAVAAAAGGTPIGISQSGLRSITPPEIDAANRSVAEVLRAVLRYHPYAVAFIQSGESGDTLRIIDRTAMATTTLDVPGSGVSDIALTPRPDLVVDTVRIIYEASVGQAVEMPAEPGELPLVRTRTRLAVHVDTYPALGSITRKSLVATLPVPADPSSDPAPPTPHQVPIVTRPLPPTGESDNAAEKWWLDHLRLTDIGLTTQDIRLPSQTVGDVQAHRVRFAWAVDDDPLNDPDRPDPINPNSTAVWRPPSVDDLPRELVSGSLAEWMRVEAAEVVVDATIGVRKSTVDALPHRDRNRVMSLNPVEGKVQGVDAYLIDAAITVTATTAKTKLYTHWPAVGQVSGTATADAVQASRDAAVIPLLARRMWVERRTLTHEGTVTLTEEDAGSRRWLGERINIVAAGQPDWATMGAIIQRESLNLDTGSTHLDIDTPRHLTERDFAELHQGVRYSSEGIAAAEGLPASPPAAGEPEDADPGSGGVFPGSVGPSVLPPSIYGEPASARRAWDLVKVDGDPPAERFELWGSRAFRSLEEIDTELTLTQVPFVPVVGSWLVARINSLTTLEITVEQLATWEGFDSAYEFTGPTNVFAAARLPLWKFHGSEATGRVPIVQGIWGEKLVPGRTLRVDFGFIQIPEEATQRTVPFLT